MTVTTPEVPAKFRKVYKKVLSGKASKTDAIRTMCMACLGWEGDYKGKSLHQSIEDCTSKSCPLYAYRPRLSESCEVSVAASSAS